MNLTISRERLIAIINDSVFTEKFWKFTNITNEELKQIYCYYREIILDGIMPITCIAGIHFNKTGVQKSCFSGIYGVKESFVELVKYLNAVVYPPLPDMVFGTTDEIEGIIYADILSLNVNGKQIKPLTKNYICTTTDKISFNLYLSTNTKNIHAEMNYREGLGSNYIPLTTSHTLWKYINIKYCDYTNKQIIQDIDSKIIDYIKVYSILKEFIIKPLQSIETPKLVINIFEFLNNVRSRLGANTIRSFNRIVEEFYNYLNDIKKSENSASVKDFISCFGGNAAEDTVANMASLRGVSRESAYQLYKEYFHILFD